MKKLLFYLILLIGLNALAQINVSTGIDAFGNALPIGTVDPFWQITSSPNPPGTPAKVATSFSPSVWQPTPVATTNAEMINPSASCCSNLNGIYTFERDFVVPSGTTNLNCDFSIAYDDDIVSLELVKPDMTTIPLTVVPTTPYHLSLPITNSISSPMAGTWKIRATINFIDSIAFYLFSGCVKLNCQTLYVDADNDGYDNGSVVDCSDTVPTGYSLTTLGADCDDTNPSIHTSFVLPTGLATGLLAQYTFNSGSINDFSGNGHHLTNIHTAVAATDRNGNANCAFEFDNLPSSNDQYLTTSSSTFLNGLTAYSISCWYKAKDPSRGIVDYEVLVGRDTGALNCPDRVGQWSLGLYDCRYAVFGKENSVWQAPGAPCNEVEVWHHLTATYNQVGNTIKLYKDGVLQNTSTGIAGCGSSLDIGDLFLGKGFTGVLDDVFIHNREITAAEVTQLYGLGSSCCSTAPCTTLITPLFNAVAPICAGDALTALPLSSTNGITGTWSPALDNTTTTTYTFTPDQGQCAGTTTMTIVVNPLMQPTFYVYPPLCQNGFAPLMPTVSLEGITGTWYPTFIDTSVVGSYIYTFTPSPGQCATTTTMPVTVNPNEVPVFNPIAPICVGDALPALPLISINGITGTWSPALDNTTTTTYTFTPDAWQCATTTTMTIVVNPQNTSITTITNCSSYTWPVNGVTYTTSGIYSDIVGCTIGLLYLTIETPTTWYIDADGDGAGNPAISIVDCVQPTGYVNNDNDCDDSNPAINPCAIEIRNDGIDNNCNGFVDEIVTKLVNSQCGSNLTSFTQLLVAQAVTAPSGSTICGYRFKVTKWVGGAPSSNPADIQIVTRSVNTFSFASNLAQFAYNTNYSVQVSVCINGVWQPYGADCCTVRCNKLSKVQASQCGTILSSMGEFVYADIVNNIMSGSSNPWRFEITQVSPGPGFGTVQTFDTNLRRFTMNNFLATYDTTYSVRVSFQNTDGTWSSYGIACTITTPPFPTTQIQTSQCGFTATNGTQLIWATGIPTTVDIPTHYRFRLSNASIPYSQTKDNTAKNFFLNQFIGLATNTTYNVEVSMEIRGVYGPYGPMCTVTTPNVFREIPTNVETKPFDAVAYPNPAVDSFQIDITTESKEPVLIQVYDLLGRLVENKQTTIDELYNLQLGNSYPSGVYEVIVKQENNLKTLRIIKR